MPFRKGTVPARLKGKGIPQSFVDQFIEVFNSVVKKSGDEGAAYRQAYGVMGRALRKAGYRQSRDGTWKKTSKKESMDETVMLGVNRPMALLEKKDIEVALVEGLRYQGTALIDHAISQQGSPWERYYSPEFNDHCLKRTGEFMEMGNVLTIYNRHESADGGFFSGSDKNPIGKVEKLYREGEHIAYEAFISPTSEGKDVIRLIYDGVMRPTSVRIYDYAVRPETLEDGTEEGAEMYVMEDGYIGGIDFCDLEGIIGAGISDILESAPHWKTVEEETMDWDAVTLEELRENAGALLQQHFGEQALTLIQRLESVESTLAEREARIAELEAQEPPEDKTAEVEAALAKIASLEEELQLRDLAEPPVVQEIVKALRELPAEERSAKYTNVRDEAINRVVATFSAPIYGEVMQTETDDVGKEPLPEKAHVPEAVERDFEEMVRFTH